MSNDDPFSVNLRSVGKKKDDNLVQSNYFFHTSIETNIEKRKVNEKNIKNISTVITEEILVSEVVDIHGCQNTNWLVFFFAALFQVSAGGQVFSASLLMPYMKDYWDLTNLEESLIGSVLFFGWLFGAFFWGWVSDHWGRLFTLKATVGGSFIISVFNAFSPNYVTFVIFRLLLGFFLPANIIYPYLTEYMPTKFRGVLMCVNHAIWSAGSVLGAFLGFIFLYYDDFWKSHFGSFIEPWSLYIIFVALNAPITLLGLLFLPKSLRYISSKNRGNEEETDQEVKKTVRYIDCLNSINPIRPCNLSSSKFGTDLSTFQFITEKKVDDDDIQHQKIRKSGIMGLFCGSRLILSIFCCNLLLMTFNSPIYYGLGLMTPSLLGSGSGGGLGITEFLGNLLGAIMEVLGVFIFIPILTFWGRKPACAISSFIVSISMILNCLFSSNQLSMIIGGKVGFTLSFISLMVARVAISGTITTTVAFMAESFPTSVRGIGVGISDSHSKLWVQVMCIIFKLFPEHLHLYPKIIIFWAQALGVIVAVIHPIEPKGKNTSDF